MHKTLLIAALAAVSLAGCEKRPAASGMPEVSDANCEFAKIMKIEDRATRETFAGLCSRRSPTGGGIELTEHPKNWLELIDQNTPKGQEAKP
ncbi:entry exclusion lipoprotein TrbK [Xanthomonas albilineans]|uniref:entry exclusion lipoprotein TrbK n=1 Tax=Xanthomonas albilineans TaxID=29447 RepID=UPI0005F307B9|nr:entry exclusion lipoprotein TrbK [Xanthomonas albilineans]